MDIGRYVDEQSTSLLQDDSTQSIVKRLTDHNKVTSNSWRRFGELRKKELLENDDQNDNNSIFTTMDPKYSMKGYFKLAERVVKQFHKMFEAEDNIEDTYIIGHRIVNFLMHVLPLHHEYMSESVAKCRSRNFFNIVVIKRRLETLSNRIDEEQLNLHIMNDFDPPLLMGDDDDDDDTDSDDADELSKNYAITTAATKNSNYNFDTASHMSKNSASCSVTTATTHLMDSSSASNSSSSAASSNISSHDSVNQEFQDSSSMYSFSSHNSISSANEEEEEEKIVTHSASFRSERSSFDTWEEFTDWENYDMRNSNKSLNNTEQLKSIPEDFNSLPVDPSSSDLDYSFDDSDDDELHSFRPFLRS